MPHLTHRQEALIRSLQTRHGRRGSPFCCCDGLRSTREIAALAPHLIESVLLREGIELPFAVPCEPVVLPEREFAKLAGTVNSQGILIVARRPDPIPADAPIPDPFAFVLDRIGDPGNFGTILRTARAIGLHEVWIVKGTVDPFSDKTLRSASGAQFAIGLRWFDDLPALAESLRRHGIRRIYRTVPSGGANLFKEEDAFRSSAILMGCEATGVAELDGSATLSIPMPGDAESLNVAQAATVVLFEYARRMQI